MAMSVAFFTATSLIAIVPLSEFRTPTLIPVALAAAAVGATAGLAAVGAAAGAGALHAASKPAADAASAAPVDARKKVRLFNIRQHYSVRFPKALAFMPRAGVSISDDVPKGR
jgi:hypothetical protein